MKQISKDFVKILEDENKNENNCQDFIEKNPKLLALNFLLNHKLHFNSIISKFPLDTSLITDFLYLTKSSNKWYIVLVELENQHIKLFTENKNQITPSAKFKSAISQIDSWRDFIRRNSDEVARRLDKIRVPLNNNIFEFKYLLVIGRDSQLKNSQEKRDRLATFEKDDLAIHTYDSFVRYFEKNTSKSNPNILTLSKNSFKFKYLHSNPNNMFAYMDTSGLILSSTQKAELISDGYDINSWETGKPLSLSGKKVLKISRNT